MQPDSAPDPESLKRAAAYHAHIIHEAEKVLIEEIEKVEGKVVGPVEMNQYGRKVFHKNGFMDCYWRGILILTVKPNQTDDAGNKGTQFIIHKQTARVEF